MIKRVEKEAATYFENVRRSTWKPFKLHLISFLIAALIVYLAYQVVIQFLGGLQQGEYPLFTQIAIALNVVLYVWLIWTFLQFQYGFVWKRMKSNKAYQEKVRKISENLTRVFTDDNAGLTELETALDADFPKENRPWLVEYLISLVASSQELVPTRMVAVYEVYRAQEQEEYDRFNEEGKRFLVRFVRIGILGTFLGLLTSFLLTANVLEMLQGIANFDPKIFLKNLQTSLSGYAFAVLSSVLANFISIIYEIVIVRKLQQVNLLQLVDTLYKSVLSGKLGGGSIVKADRDIYQTIGDELVNIKITMNQLRINLTEDMKKLTVEISSAFSAPRAFTTQLKSIFDNTIAHFKNILEGLESEAEDMKKMTKAFSSDVRKMQEETHLRIKLIVEDFIISLEAMKNGATSEIVSMKSSVLERLEQLRKDVHSDIGAMDSQNKKFLKNLDDILLETLNQLNSQAAGIHSVLSEVITVANQVLSTIKSDASSIKGNLKNAKGTVADMEETIDQIREATENIQLELGNLSFPDKIKSWSQCSAEIDASIDTIHKTIAEVKRLNSILIEGKPKDQIVTVLQNMRQESQKILEALRSFRNLLGDNGGRQ